MNDLALAIVAIIVAYIAYLMLTSKMEDYVGFPARMYLPIRELPAYQGGFGTPIDNINDVPQLQQMEQVGLCDQLGDDSIGNLKLTSQHLNLIKNIN